MRSILITGVTSGIGLACAEHAILQGARVFGSVRRVSDAERLIGQLGSLFVPLVFDVRDETAMRGVAARLRETLGGRTLDGLVNNAGIAQPGPVLHQPLSEIRNQIETDLVSVFATTQIFGPLLGADRTLAGEPGRIVIMSSIAGAIGQPFMGAYVASKHGLEGLAGVLRRELQLFGIDVVTIGPALVNTPIWGKATPAIGRYRGTDYAEAFDRGTRAMVEAGHRHAMAPAEIGALVWRALTDLRPSPRYAPARHPVVEQWLPRILPRRWLDRAVGLALGLRRRER